MSASDVEIDWQVIVVFDPHGGGQDFAYTRGLHANHGVCELHLWARPVDGTDPGADWKFSANDCGRLLNMLARREIAGEFTDGAEWSEELDAGFTTIRYTAAGVPVASPELDTFQLRDGTPVRAVRFAIERVEPDAGRWPVDGTVVGRMGELCARVDAAAELRSMLLGDGDPGHPLFDLGSAGTGGDATVDGVSVDGVSGEAAVADPWGGPIGRLRQMVRTASSPLWDTLVFGAVFGADRLRWSLAVCAAAARASARVGSYDAACAAAGVDAAEISAMFADPDDPDSDRMVEAGRMALHTWLAAAYGAVVVADVVDTEVFDAAAGWLLALADPFDATRRWCAAHGVEMPDGSLMLDSASVDELAELVERIAVDAAAGRGAPLCIPVDVALAAIR